MNIINKKIELSDGRVIEIETGKLAKQADGSAVIKMGGTMLLATVCAAKEVKEGTDFMPLTVDYKEKFYAAGRFPGGFMKREGKSSDYEILISRLIDRPIRPLWPSDYHLETFVNVTLISADKDTQPDALAGLAASCALAASDLPFEGPISEVRVCRIDGQFVINPGFEDMKRSDIELMVAATEENIMMVEGEMKEVSEHDMLEAIKFAHEEIKKHCRVQKELIKELGNDVKRDYPHDEEDEDLRKAVHEFCYDKCYALAKSAKPKHEREDGFAQIKEEFLATLSEEDQEAKAAMVARYYGDEEKAAMRNMILDEGIRLDGRSSTQVRPIWCEVGYLPCAHGSAIFTRGETQSLATVTLGTKLDMKEMDEVLVQDDQQIVLHYNFPPFSTGEARPQRGVGRREIGHGNLALRALKPVIPTMPENPYAVRIVSDILESNGSSSMASVCGGCLALMDAGVKIKKPVAGVAMGLITDKDRPNERYAILTDILGDEDHLGDMDFKVTGTADGITATQMDIKVDGLSYDVLAKALEQARQGRLHIMGEMMKTISEPREDYKPFVPRIKQIEIESDFIGAVIGKGGETIQKIQKETGTTITITEDTERHKGIVDIFSADRDALDKALAWIEGICAVPEVGAVYHGKVVSILDFGAFVEILPGKEGLLHVSEIAWEKTENVADVLKVGDEVDVKLLEIDEKSGKMRLSMRVLQDKPEGYVEPERRPRGPRDDRKGDRRPNDRRAPRDDRRAPRDDRRGERRDDRKAPRRPFGQKNEEAAEKAPDFETGSEDILF
ncbi:MAG: polyribonucleotide nucleotidyltransferase [Candidatus Cryptobacteroides sp.]|nr:polyribonucleotide nucleotidyltransferase [Bacteroidales bacterium]MDY3226977.1 polyribonucleotide nucleotidyltransferase [Candidatus Cryptobacteroides sp.]MCI7634892.1 polyribonucleotide nucleotidyltransferase [Bacteroidales bacterium]MDD7117668.1 polyribonucleotide nucleotidyltransferase [Bacteroidales bacterium]MDD7154226.1 polyribonucleotide nucleotidyltransferase [Bacteroidales bacterium]